MTPTVVYDTYWRFAAERQSIYEKRLFGAPAPWTEDPVLRSYRFTNAFRAADRVSQYLIRHVQYCENRSDDPSEVFFRTLLFKFFNRIETWEFIEDATGPVAWARSNLGEIGSALDRALDLGQRIYSAAYIMPSPTLGNSRKHRNHLALLHRMMLEGLPGRIEDAKSLQDVYNLLLSYPGIGPFLAFQYAIDLNYSSVIEFAETDFVVPGPGALDGISKCFADLGGQSPVDAIYAMYEAQDSEFSRLGLSFSGLFGRPLQPIDCQNLFCEIAKYSRVVHPNVEGCSGRTRIKQGYNPQARSFLEQPMFPPRWGLEVGLVANSYAETRQVVQGSLF